jgi:hypothetical protein
MRRCLLGYPLPSDNETFDLCAHPGMFPRRNPAPREFARWTAAQSHSGREASLDALLPLQRLLGVVCSLRRVSDQREPGS